MVYLGYRPGTTFDLHQRFYGNGMNYPFHQFHLCKAQFLERFFRKYYSEYEFGGGREEKVFGEKEEGEDGKGEGENGNGANRPHRHHQRLRFDSSFEGGNLDAVYY